jgi:hypothetical protein
VNEQLSFWGLDEEGRSVRTGQRLIYFVECGEFVKIGFTTRDVSERISELECGNPASMKLIGTMVVHDESDDRRLHKRFAIFHHRGEWFRKTPELLRAIEELLYSTEQPQNIATAQTPIVIKLWDKAWVGEEGFMYAWDCPSCRRCLSFNGGFHPNPGTDERRKGSSICKRCHTRMQIHFVRLPQHA